MEAITRKEKIMSGENLTPITRKELFLAKAAGQDVKVPTPITREEWFLSRIGQGGGSTPDTPTIPEYNGVIPKGTYTITRFAGENESPNHFTGDGDTWFKYNGKSCLELYFFDGVIWDIDGNDYYFSKGDTIEVFREIEVSKEEFDAFMYFCGLRDTISDYEPDTPAIPEYNGVIPTGNYVCIRADEGFGEMGCYEDVYWFTVPSYDENEQCDGIYWYEDFPDVLLGSPVDAEIPVGATINVFADYEVTEEQYNTFMQYFTPQ